MVRLWWVMSAFPLGWSRDELHDEPCDECRVRPSIVVLDDDAPALLLCPRCLFDDGGCAVSRLELGGERAAART